MLFKKPELTSGFRPVLLPNEEILAVQDDVGLYEGKFKVAQCQKGHVYLTTHRLCYVDDDEPSENSLSLDLKDVERHIIQAGFLRSSAKILLYLKPPRNPPSVVQAESFGRSRASRPSTSQSSPTTRSNSPTRSTLVYRTIPKSNGTWICPICSFANPVPSNFDPRTAKASFPIPSCLACGVQPSFATILKAAINASSNQAFRAAEPDARPEYPNSSHVSSATQPLCDERDDDDGIKVTCPRCTFRNYPSLPACEICGTALPTQGSASNATSGGPIDRVASPGPMTTDLQLNEDVINDGIRISFRGGGEKACHEKLKGAMVQRRWLLEAAPPIPRTTSMSQSSVNGSSALSGNERPRSTPVGIAGLEHRGLQSRKDNETTIGSAFEDLETLMASAKDIVALAQKFAVELGSSDTSVDGNALLSESAAAMGIVATRAVVGDKSTNLYLSELSRNLAEYITDDRRGILSSQGGIMGLIDLWAMFNRSRNGYELISPFDFQKATQLWDELNLPVKLRRFKSGLLVVQRRTWTDDRILEHLQAWLQSTKRTPLSLDVSWEWSAFGSAVTAQDAAGRFGWSIGVAVEELEMAEDRGLLCREDSVEGLKFWLNCFVEG